MTTRSDRSHDGRMQAQGSMPLDGHPVYEFVRDLSSGGFGAVQLARHKQSKQMVAIKFMPRGEGITRMTLREVCNHARLRHPHIVAFRGVFLTRKYLALVMEVAQGGNLLSYVNQRGGLTESEARWLFQQEIIGLDYVHRKGVVVRDVKLENTLLDTSAKPLVKFCDFGFTKSREDSAPKTTLGTFGYTAPEVITEQQQYDGKLADVWSTGVMLYVKLFLKYPFQSSAGDRRSVLAIIKEARFSVPLRLACGDATSDECEDLLRSILVADPLRRLTLQQIQLHPWFRKDLPPGLDTFNDKWIARQDQQPTSFDVDKISALVKQARQLG